MILGDTKCIVSLFSIVIKKKSCYKNKHFFLFIFLIIRKTAMIYKIMAVFYKRNFLSLFTYMLNNHVNKFLTK